MDFNSIKKAVFKVFDHTIIVQLKHPVTGELLKDEDGLAEIEIFRRDSKFFQDYFKEITKRASQGVKDERPIPEQNAEFFKTITKSVNNVWLGDEKISQDNCEKLYDSSLDWVQDQLIVALKQHHTKGLNEHN